MRHSSGLGVFEVALEVELGLQLLVILVLCCFGIVVFHA